MNDRAPRGPTSAESVAGLLPDVFGFSPTANCGKDKEVLTCDAEAGEPSTPLAKPPDTTWPKPPQSKRQKRSELWKNETSRRRRGGHGLRHALHDVPPLQYIPHGGEQLTAAYCGTGLVSVRIAAQAGGRGVEIFNVNISTPRPQRPPARKAQRAKNSHSGNFRTPIAKRSLANLVTQGSWAGNDHMASGSNPAVQSAPLSNDDIGLEHRLELFRLQVEIRDCEKRLMTFSFRT